MTLKIGMIGTGWFSRKHADILLKMDGVQIQAICGTSKEKAAAMASDYEGANGYDQYVEMLDAEELDAVYIVTPPMVRGEMELELIGRGIPFLIEKPLGTEDKIPAKVLERMNESSLITSVGYHFRYSDSVQRLKENINGQKLGMVLGKWMGEMPMVSWWRDQEKSGGQFIEQTTHIVDLLRYVCGEVEEVYAMYGNQVQHNKHDNVTVPDIGTVSLRLQNGVVANLSNTCVLPSGMGEVGLKLYTDKGILDWQGDKLEIDQEGIKTMYKDTDNPYVRENEAFIHAIRTGDTSQIRSDYSDAYQTHKVTYAALESARSGVPVKLKK
ncbi:oxidoreductase [Terribacillus saccharophilus]|uniref:Gfo/Idh/MocA family protein n=1 Tax=Terribacillus saccharophilus TaxID=361277 RepID=UPI000BA50605|nr:Gfo/Idh/MocA family oxidoreductase [Terribacillus saccharophilus]PAF21222.1 oxidoreductase [Terribacillus saccharophilus]